MRRRPGRFEAILILVAGGLLAAGCELTGEWPWVRNMYDHPGPVPQEDPLPPPDHSLSARRGSGPQPPAPGTAAAGEPAGERGKVLFERYCATCHGREGRGRDLTDDYFSPDLTEEDYLDRLDEELFSVIVDGGINMPGYRDALSEPEVHLVIEYLRYLQGNDEP